MKIVIAVPTFENIFPDTFKAIYDLDKCGNEVVFEYVRGYDCATARNKAVELAKKANADYIFFIDNDTIPGKDALKLLLEDNHDIVFGYCAKRKRVFDGESSLCKLNEKYESRYTENELKEIRDSGNPLIEIHGGGASCTLIKMDVFNKIGFPYFDWVNYKNGAVLSEDYYFCEQCKKHGIKIYGDTRVKCGHIFRYNQEMI